MKLIVGLGNPGKKYEGTRHNVGFEVVKRLADRLGMGPAGPQPMQARFDSLAIECRLDPPSGESAGKDKNGEDEKSDDERVLLLLPQTYMNNSGRAARQAAQFYKIPLENLLVVCDDFHLPTGKLRTRKKGSAGGQNGLDDILRQLGSEEIPRLRLGVGPVPEGWDTAGFVLGRFSKDEQEIVDEMVQVAADAAQCWIRQGITETMNRFN